MKLYAFADEASPLLKNQIAAMHRNGLQGLEIRNTDFGNVSTITPAQAGEIRKMMDDAGLTVWSCGSPIGKIAIDGDFKGHLEVFRRTLEVTNILGAQNMRMFSFYMPGEKDPAAYRNQVMDYLGQLLHIADGTGIDLCHENEKGIYGDIAPRCREIFDALPALKCVFDPANFIQSGQETLSAWEMLKPFVKYMHVKDALPSGQVVPAGKGAGHLPEILSDFKAMGGEHLSVEPHLKVFSGLENLEHGEKTVMDDFAYPTSDIAFDAACSALKALL
ncbi:MAG: sugar phosphate isomerase/epimerase [Clostridia bacterium]|nr:sugar phosphate isomerase/epimerase [Clostridia bacterium]